MDENDALKVGLEVVLKPVTEVTENAIGVLGGDYLSEVRARRRAKLKQRTEEILKENGVDHPNPSSPSVLLPLLGNAQDEEREELFELWARLIAMSMNPQRCRHYRRIFAQTLQRLEPADAAVLQTLHGFGTDVISGGRGPAIVNRLGMPADEMLITLDHLLEMGLTVFDPHRGGATLTPLGREFCAALSLNPAPR